MTTWLPAQHTDNDAERNAHEEGVHEEEAM